MKFAYADPPYPGQAWKYRGHPDYAGEVDHAQLIAQLIAQFDGWALSTSAAALPNVLALCPASVRVAAWHITNSEPPGNRPTNWWWSWEPLIISGGRREGLPIRDVLIAAAPHGTVSELVGSKPAVFCRWLFGLAGLRPDDEFADLFPGSGGVAREWANYRDQLVLAL